MSEERRSNSNHLTVEIEHLRRIQQNRVKEPKSAPCSDILVANDFFSVFDEIMLHNSLCRSNNSGSSSCHPGNCCLCNLSSSNLFDPSDPIILPFISSSTTDLLYQNFEKANAGADIDEIGEHSGNSRQNGAKHGGKLKIPTNCCRVGDILWKKFQIYLKFLSTRKFLRKCENCCHSLKTACKSFVDSTRIIFTV